MKKAVIGIIAAALMMSMGVVQAAGGASAGTSDRITINLASRILTLYQNGRKAYMYHICAGKIETPTPVGNFTVSDKEENPTWVDPKDHKKRVEPGEENPLGQRWIGFYDMYGIHGTNRPDSIGGYYSNGCIRLNEEDVEQLYPKVEIGTKVEIYYNRLVIETMDDGTVVYYVYPDGYGRQPLDVRSVRKALDEYGVGVFLTNEDISEKIENEDGGPTFLPRTFRIEIDDRWLSARAVMPADSPLYLPVQALSNVTKIDYTRDVSSGTVNTVLGTAQGVVFGNQLFVKADEGKVLFGLSGDIDADRTMRLVTNKPIEAKPEEKAPDNKTNYVVQTEKPAAEKGTSKMNGFLPEAGVPSKITSIVQGKTK